MRVIVTRPAAQAGDFITRLLAMGVDAVALPLICIEALADGRPIIDAWRRLNDQALVMFVSANAVAHFFRGRPADVPWPPAVLAGGTGPGTQAALRAAGVPEACIVVPPPQGPHDTETLWTRLQGRAWAGRQVLLVRGEQGRDWLATQLQAAGAVVQPVAAYRRLPPAWGAAERRVTDTALAQPSVHAWHFSSSEALLHLRTFLQAAVGPDGLVSPAAPSLAVTALSHSIALATHPRIADAARGVGFGSVQVLAVGPEAVAAWAASIESPPL